MEELTYGTNEMFSGLNIFIKMFAKPSTVEIIVFGYQNESILTIT